VKVKLDENLGSAGAEFLRARSVDVVTVAEQDLRSSPDTRLIDVCAAEDRCLITLDLDFSNPLQYMPSNYAGIVVVRIPGRFRLSELERAPALVVQASTVSDVRGRLWIAEADRLREHIERC
jgi:predicted nuclease of predicted toxin-antitoxin system